MTTTLETVLGDCFCFIILNIGYTYIDRLYNLRYL